MKQISIFLVLLLGTCMSSLAQLTITLPSFPPYNFQRDDIWNFSVYNSGDAINGLIRIQVRNGGLQVLSSQAAHRFAGGNNLLTGRTISNPTYGYPGGGKYSALSNGSVFPYGAYEICVFITTDNKEEVSQCTELEIIPLSPPALVSPSDKSEIETLNPLLTWFPPSAVRMTDHVAYDLKLVEILHNQSAFDAVRRNLPVYHQQGLTNNYLLYPVNAMPLQVGHSYAWVIIGKVNGVLVGETEIWSFRIVSPVEPESTASNKIYTKPKSYIDGSFIEVHDKVYFTYDEEYTLNALDIKLTSLNGKEYKVSSELMKKMGENNFEINLSDIRKLSKNDFYILEIYSVKKEKQYVLIKYLGK